MSKSENRPSQAAMKKMGFFVSEAFCHLKHRPYFSNTLSPKQPGDLIKESPGCWGCGGTWPRGRVSRGPEAGPAPHWPGMTWEPLPAGPRPLVQGGSRCTRPVFSVLSGCSLLWVDTGGVTLRVFPSHSQKRWWCFGPRSGS